MTVLLNIMSFPEWLTYHYLTFVLGSLACMFKKEIFITVYSVWHFPSADVMKHRLIEPRIYFVTKPFTWYE